MKPAPIMPTRIGLPCSSRARSALSTMIIAVVRSSEGHALLELGLDFHERLPSVVLVRDDREWERPAQTQGRIIVHQAAFDARRVELADLIARLGFVFERLVAVGEALRYVQRSTIVRAELH